MIRPSSMWPFAGETLLHSVELALAHDLKARSLEADRIPDHGAADTAHAPRARGLHHGRVGQAAKQIAAELGISPRTVEHHREHLMAKMNAATWHDLFSIAVIGGLYEPHL